MKNSMSTFFSIVMIGLGLLTVVWVSSSFLGKAHSQQSQNPQLPGQPGNSAGPGQAQGPGKPSQANPNQPIPDQATPGQTNPQVNPSQAGPGAPTMDLPPAESPAPVMPGFQNSEGYVYDPSGRRDPFRPFGQSQFAGKIPLPMPDQAMPKMPAIPLGPAEPLQQYDIAQLKVIAIVWGVQSPKAMIRDPLGKLHMVIKESRIGRNNGFVAAIREGEVIVVEPTIGEGGTQTASTRVMSLIR